MPDCVYCLQEELANLNSQGPLLKVCDCTRINPIHRECLDTFRSMNTEAVRKCPTCKNYYTLYKMDEKFRRRNYIYYTTRLIAEISASSLLFLCLGTFTGQNLKRLDTHFNRPVSHILGNCYNFMGFSLLGAGIGFYGIWYERTLIKNAIRICANTILESLTRQIPETPEERATRELHSATYELRSAIREMRYERHERSERLRRHNAGDYEAENRRDSKNTGDKDSENDSKEKDSKTKENKSPSYLSLATASAIIFVVGGLAAAGIVYSIIKAPLVIKAYVDSRRKYFGIRNESADLKVLAFNVPEDRKLAKDMGIDLPEC